MVISNYSHSSSSSSNRIQAINDLRKSIADDQLIIRNEDPKLKRLEQEIIKDRAELIKKENEAKHSHEHLQGIRDELTRAEHEFKLLQIEIQKMQLGRN